MYDKVETTVHDGYRVEKWQYESEMCGASPIKIPAGLMTFDEFSQRTTTSKEFVRAVTVTGREVGEHWFFTEYDSDGGYKSPEAALQHGYFVYLEQNGAENLFVGNAKKKTKAT